MTDRGFISYDKHWAIKTKLSKHPWMLFNGMLSMILSISGLLAYLLTGGELHSGWGLTFVTVFSFILLASFAIGAILDAE